MVKKIFSGILLTLLTPLIVLASVSSSNTGFVSGPVWFSNTTPAKDTNTISVYSAIFNDEDLDVDFSVSLMDNGITVQSKNINIFSKETKTITFDWNVGKGKHTFVAKITEAYKNGISLDVSKKNTQSVSLSIGESVPVHSDVGSSNKSIKLLESINFKPDSFESKAKDWLIESIDKLESWRVDKSNEAKTSLAKVKSDRENLTETKPAVKVLSFLHMWGLMIAGFILAISALFYLVGFILVVWVIKKSFQIIRFIFHRREE